MAHWNEAAVTNTGVELLNEWMAGRKLTITAAYGGTGTVEADKLPEQTGLVNQKQKLSLLGKEDSKTGVTVQVQVNNLGLEEEYELNQVMVMAALDRDKDPDSEEKCLFIMQDQKGVDIPAEDDDEVFLLELYCAIGITNNGRFTVSVDTTGIVSISRMTEAIKKALDEHNADQEAHGGILGGQEQQYSAEKTYKAGAYCNKDGKLYKCKEDITEPEEWNPEHWDATTVTKELEGTQVTADKATETAEKAVEEALEQITTSPVAEDLTDSDAFAAVTAAGIKRTPLSLLKQVFGKLFAPAPLTQNLALYVNAATGSDSNDGLAAERPKKTIMAAINAIPKNLGKYYAVVNIAAGTYDGDLVINGFFGFGSAYPGIRLEGAQTEDVIISGNVRIQTTLPVHIKQLTVNGSFNVYYSNVLTQKMAVHYNTPLYAIDLLGTSFTSFNLDVVNDIGAGLRIGGGTAYLTEVSGNVSSTGIISGNNDSGYGGLVVIGINTMTAETKYQKVRGGAIIENGRMVE